MKGLSLKVLIGLNLIDLSVAAYTAIQYFPKNAIYAIDDELNAKEILDTEDVTAISITNDPITGNTYVITGDTTGDQTLNRLCEGKLFPVAAIKPSTVNLYCLTSGPNGLYAIDSNIDKAGVALGKLDVTTGKFTNLASVEGPYDSLVMAQNADGLIYYINANGKTWTNSGEQTKMRIYTDAKFDPGLTNFCGEFDKNGNIIATTDAVGGGIARYNLRNEAVKIFNLKGGDYFLNDITMNYDNIDYSAKGTCATVSPTIAPFVNDSPPTKPKPATPKPVSKGKGSKDKKVNVPNSAKKAKKATKAKKGKKADISIATEGVVKTNNEEEIKFTDVVEKESN